MKKRWIRAVTAACLLSLAAAAFTGCKKDEPKKEAKVEEEVLNSIGKQTDDAIAIRLANSTGKDIKGFSVKKSQDEAFPANMLSASDVYKAKEERILYYEDAGLKKADQKKADEAKADAAKTDASKEETAKDEPTQGVGEKVLTQGYDVELTFADDTKAVLHGFPFEDMEEGELLLDNEIAYVKYTSLSSGQTLETLESEKAIVEAKKAEEEAKKAEEEAAAAKKAEEEAAAAAQKQAEEEAAAAAAAAQPAQPAYEEPAPAPSYSEPAPAPAPEPAPAPAPSDDEACLTDGLTY